MVKLVVHIGHGKTGSSSIQASLLAAQGALRGQGVRYLGLMLESATLPDRKSWQYNGGSDFFFDKMPEEQAIREIEEVIEQEVSTLASMGVKTAVWSNEWILERPSKVLPALRNLLDRGIDIQIQVYLRRHDKWAISAYTQWGVRHKTYPGPVKPFERWAAERGLKFATYYPLVSPWLAAFPGRVHLFNFDAAGDVTTHFLAANGITGVPSLSENVSPSREVIAAHAAFNNGIASDVRPNEFNRILANIRPYDQNDCNAPPIDELMPSPEVLRRFMEPRMGDIEAINGILRRMGEPELKFDTPAREFHHPTPWEMDQFMLKLLYTLSDKVEGVEARVQKLTADMSKSNRIATKAD